MQEFFTQQTEMRCAWLKHSASFTEKFYTPDCINRKERGFILAIPPETIESVVRLEASAEVVTSGLRFRTMQHRQRYHLQAFGETWQISCIDMECCICHATGKNESGSAPCEVCKGKGWMS